jgi:hypothetical protein
LLNEKLKTTVIEGKGRNLLPAFAFTIFKAVLKVNASFYAQLIAVEGAKTPAGSPPAPRKSKRLVRKSTAKFNTAKSMKIVRVK